MADCTVHSFALLLEVSGLLPCLTPAVQPEELWPSAIEQHSLPKVKVKAGRTSNDAQGQELIAAGFFTSAVSPASIEERISSEAFQGARSFRLQRLASASSDDDRGSRPAASSYQRGPKVQLDVGFEELGLKLNSCGKVVLQGVCGRLEHGRLAAVMGPSGELCLLLSK